jgi:hypothetical protein
MVLRTALERELALVAVDPLPAVLDQPARPGGLRLPRALEALERRLRREPLARAAGVAELRACAGVIGRQRGSYQMGEV